MRYRFSMKQDILDSIHNSTHFPVCIYTVMPVAHTMKVLKVLSILEGIEQMVLPRSPCSDGSEKENSYKNI